MSKQPLASAVFFVDENDGITRELSLGEFEAILDGLVSLQELAGVDQRAVYAQINNDLRVVACVLFRVPFDETGSLPGDWNLLFDQLIISAGKGPDLGAGPIKLSTAVQCSVPWHQAKLWDPAEVTEVFAWLSEAVSENRLNLTFEPQDGATLEDEDSLGGGNSVGGAFEEDGGSIIETQESPFFSDDNAYGAEQGLFSANGPRLGEYSPHEGMYGAMPPPPGYPPHMAPPHAMPYGYDPSRHAPPGYYPPPMMSQQHMPPTMAVEAHMQQLTQQFHQKEQLLVEKLKQAQQRQKQELQQQKARVEARLKSVTRDYDNALRSANTELARLRTKVENLMTQKESLSETCATQKVQVAQMREKMEQFRARAEERERESSAELSRKYEMLSEKRVREIEQETQKQLNEKEAEIVYRQEVIKQLRKDITLMRRDKIRLVNSGADKFLERLEELGISFIAFHAGAGHISIPLRDMSAYIENPMAYAANRCLVSEELYQAWLTHYDNPVCRFVVSEKNNEICGCRVRKTDVPSDFQAGVSDRCDKHRSLVAGWNNVVSINN